MNIKKCCICAISLNEEILFCVNCFPHLSVTKVRKRDDDIENDDKDSEKVDDDSDEVTEEIVIDAEADLITPEISSKGEKEKPKKRDNEESTQHGKGASKRIKTGTFTRTKVRNNFNGIQRYDFSIYIFKFKVSLLD